MVNKSCQILSKLKLSAPTWLSLQKYLLMQGNVMEAEFNYWFFFQCIYRNVTFAIVFNFLGHKNSLFAFTGGIVFK